LLLTFTPKLSDDFSFRGVLGHNYNQRTQTDQINIGNQYIVRGIHTLANTAQQIFNTDIYERRRLVGVFGDVSLGYKNYAFVEVTGRNDWSSTLPVENRSYFYPSVSGSLIFTDALKLNSPYFNLWKLRAGWAKVGRDADPYSLLDVFTLGTNFLGSQQELYLPRKIIQTSNLNLPRKWRSVRNLISSKEESARLYMVSQDLHKFNCPYFNPTLIRLCKLHHQLWKISNKGIEIDLTVMPLKLRDFTWEVHGAFTKNKSVVEELTAGVDRLVLFGVLANTISPYLEPGLPFGYLRGTKVIRDSLGNALINPATGGMIVSPEEGFIGDPNPGL
jgi:hypothetical protein